MKLSKVSLGLIICASLLVGGLAGGAYGDLIYNRHNEEKQERAEAKLRQRILLKMRK